MGIEKFILVYVVVCVAINALDGAMRVSRHDNIEVSSRVQSRLKDDYRGKLPDPIKEGDERYCEEYRHHSHHELLLLLPEVISHVFERGL